jgi:hypothetical protein
VGSCFLLFSSVSGSIGVGTRAAGFLFWMRPTNRLEQSQYRNTKQMDAQAQFKGTDRTDRREDPTTILTPIDTDILKRLV